MNKIIIFTILSIFLFETDIFCQWYPNPEVVYSFSSDTSDVITYYYSNNRDKLGELKYDEKKLIKAKYYYKNGDSIPNTNFKNGNGKLNFFGYETYPIKTSKPNGCYGNFTNGLANGKFQCYNKGKLVSEYSYTNGMANGNCKLYTIKGIIIEEMNFKNDSLDGPYNMYTEKGEPLTECYYKNNKLHGTYKIYFYGELLIEKNYKEDLLDGDCITYNQNGTIAKKEYYIKGKKRRKK